MTDNRTNELREKLDALGIEHFDYDKGGRTQTQWEAPDGKRHFTYETSDNPAKTARLVIAWHPTPEQAIAATLGNEPPYDELLRCLENDWHVSASWDGLRKFWCIELTDEGVRLRDAAHGTLTAEQVEDAVYRHCKFYEGGEVDAQAIADALNATMGRGTCKLEETESYPSERGMVHVLECSNCGRECEHVNGDYEHCPHCLARNELF